MKETGRLAYRESASFQSSLLCLSPDSLYATKWHNKFSPLWHSDYGYRASQNKGNSLEARPLRVATQKAQSKAMQQP